MYRVSELSCGVNMVLLLDLEPYWKRQEKIRCDAQGHAVCTKKLNVFLCLRSDCCLLLLFVLCIRFLAAHLVFLSDKTTILNERVRYEAEMYVVRRRR